MKTDKIDSVMLATLLRGGFVAECYVPSSETIDLRELVRFRANLVRERTKMKNQIHAYLLQNNVSIGASPFSREFVDELRKLENPRVQAYLRLVESLNREIREASITIREKARSDPGAILLMSIPGISFFSALLIVSEIGEIGRFEDSSSLVALFRVGAVDPLVRREDVPRPDNEVGEQVPQVGDGPMREGPHEAEPDGTVATFYARIKRKKGDQKAIVAASAKLLKIVSLGPQGEEGVSQLRGMAAAIYMRARASKN